MQTIGIHGARWITAGVLGAGIATTSGLAENVTTTEIPTTEIPMVEALTPGGIARQFSAPTVGHPAMPDQAVVERGVPVTPFDPDAPPASPLEQNWYVNFESPPIDAIALSSDGATLFAANTPNGTLAIIDVSGLEMVKVGEIPTGIEPVSVGIQPGTNDRMVWVLNFVSDTCAVVDTLSGRVVDIVRVGDEPASITFSDDGSTAFVVTQGPPALVNGDAVRQESGVVAIDTATRQILGKIILDMNTPRRSVMVPGQNKLVVAALRSGNNTTVVGEPALYELVGGGTTLFPNLFNVSNFTLTQGLFADPGLSPWPDLSPVPGATFVQRIVKDRGQTTNNVWFDIIETLNGGTGGDTPDPTVLAQWQAEFPTVDNASDVLTVTITDAKDTADNDLAVIDVSDPAAMFVESMVGGVGTALTGLALRPGVDGIEVLTTNIEPFNTTRHEPTLNGNFAAHEVVRVSNLAGGGGGAVAQPFDLHAGIANFGDVSQFNPEAWDNALANPTDVEFNELGTVAFVAALGSSRIGAVDPDTGSVFDVIDVPGGPRSLAYDAAGGFLYVLSRSSMGIERIDVSTPSLLALRGGLALFNPEPDDIREGRGFMHSSLLANNAGFSCATCHLDGVFDALAWDLGNPDKAQNETKPFITADILGNPCLEGAGDNHPLKGPMVTLSLQGLKDHTELHWRGDREQFQDFQGAFSGLQGGVEPSDEEMDVYTAFVNSIVYPPNPFRNPDNTFKDPVGATGRDVYMNSCTVCHSIENDGALQLDCEPQDVAFNISGGLFAQVQLVPQLRGIYKKFDMDLYNGFGLLHDGREEREANDHPLDTFLQNFFQGIINTGLDDDLIAFVQGFQSNVMPIVGLQTVAAAPGASEVFATPGFEGDIDLMIQQHDLFPSRCDVIAKGIVDGVQRGYYLFSTATPSPTFRSDAGTSVLLAELLLGVANGDSLVFTAVPPGSGRRMGVDQDDDCVSDLLDPDPQDPMLNPDYNHDGQVDTADLGQMISAFGTINAALSLNDDPIIDTSDLGIMIGAFGICP